MSKDRYRTIKYCAYALLLVALSVLENARGTAVSLWGGSLSAVPFLIAAVALFEGPYAAGGLGFAAGMISSIHSPMIEGLDALYLGLFGIAFGVIGAAYMRQVMLTAALGGAACLVFQGLCRYVFYYGLFYGVPLLYGLQGVAVHLALSILPGIGLFYIVRRLYRRFGEAEV